MIRCIVPKKSIIVGEPRSLCHKTRYATMRDPAHILRKDFCQKFDNERFPCNIPFLGPNLCHLQRNHSSPSCLCEVYDPEFYFPTLVEGTSEPMEMEK